MGKTTLWKWPIIWLIFVLSFFFAPNAVLASDLRVDKVASYLSKHDSPLVYYASDFVQAADKYQLDYRLLAAISGIESTFGRNYIRGTYNAYGWGGGLIVFTSWPDGIFKISQALKTNYIDRGANDIYQIGAIYCPPNSVSWAQKVNYFMEEIEKEDTSNFALVGPIKLQDLPLTI